MKLISKYKDYYDGLQATDRDQTPLYIRKNHTEFIPQADKAKLAELGLTQIVKIYKKMPDGNDLGFSRALVGFCGKLYPYYLQQKTKLYTFKRFKDSGEALASVQAEPMPQYANERITWGLRQKEAQKLLEKGASNGWGLWSQPQFNAGGWEHWMTVHNAKLLISSHDNVFRALDIPVFRIRSIDHKSKGHGIEIEYNPKLKALDFATIMPPYAAWQQIDQYLGNQLAKQEDPAPLSDELRRDAHGFDTKSFKQTAPGEKKHRRKNRKNK